MKSGIVGAMALAACIITPVCSVAEEYSESLSQCIVKATTPADRQTLLRWMFSAMARHPDLEAYANIKPSQAAGFSHDAGALFQRLMVEDCRAETVAVIRNEGLNGIEKGFSFLGETAMFEMMTNPKVKEALSDLDKGIDKSKFEALGRESSELKPPKVK